jgi:hypothetical protein
MRRHYFVTFFLIFILSRSPVTAQHVNLAPEKKEILPTTAYAIYIPWGTLPTLYSAIHMQLHNKPSFLWFLRTGTLDPEFLPRHVTLIGTPGNPADVALIGEKIREILTENPDASFTLYTDDMQSGRIALDVLIGNGVKEGNYQIRILSDGSGTYNFYKNLFNVANGGLDTYNNAAAYYFNLFRRAAQTKTNTHVPKSNPMWADLANQMFALGSYPFAEMWLSFPDLLTSDDFRIPLARMQIKTRTVTPQFLFKCMNRSQTESFLRLVGFSRAYFDSLLKISPALARAASAVKKTAASEPEEGITQQPAAAETLIADEPAAEKHKLIVTMSDPIPAGFTKTLAKIIKDYQDEYDIFLKPHPNSIPNEKEIAHYKKMGVTEVLPGRMPMEVFLWAYPDIKIGGYQSSLYMTAGEQQTLFFISNGAYDLPEPLASLYNNGGFSGVRFYNRF